ncbi:hypothetical protein BDB00DRAFT_937718 [Zychaea mexicana]|uniref:uncharacterized protein n=1 Tax=Zychaea mexicana TaxID=64656 RepID=UPI0022FDE680|nr:uncharacterized protein BDB00DRAFT_937718 [Zychaea mexicana]KAI9495398.1 hypothetical protein BDB00DRAFT_937718 [Zychaea mexicana]
MVKKFLLAVAVGAPVAVMTIKHFTSLPWGNDLDALCPGYKNTDLTGHDGLDNLLCKVINIFTHAINDPLGQIISWLLLGLFASVLAIWGVEGSRVKANLLLSSLALWGMAANLFTLSAVMFGLWLPAYYFCYGDDNSNIPNYGIPSARSTAVLVAVVVGFIFPSLAMLLFPDLGDAPWSHTQTIIVALWQLAPLVVMPIYVFSTSTFACMEEPLDPRIGREGRERRRVADQKSGVETVHLVLAFANAVLYYIMIFRASGRGLFNWETLVDAWTLHSGKLTILSIEQRGHIDATHFFLVDLLVAWAGVGFWALLESGLVGVFILVVGTIFTGPGAGVSLYAAYRESHVQDNDRLVVKKNE